MYWFITIVIIALFISANAIYVAAEISTVSSRRARLAQMGKNGDQTAIKILNIVENHHNLDAYVAACQVGITISSLILGYFGQARLADSISMIITKFGEQNRFAADSISAAIVLLCLSIFQVVLGELVPKNIGLQYPESLAILTHKFTFWSGVILKPVISFFNGSGLLLMRLLNINLESEYTHIHSPEEISLLMSDSQTGGLIKEEEYNLLKNTLSLWETPLRLVMIPRSKILTAPDTIPHNSLFKLLTNSPYSRIPIYSENIDNIVGVIHLRDLLCQAFDNKPRSIPEIIHPVFFVYENTKIKRVFSLLQEKNCQVAIAVDEYGGISGMVTQEDLIEQIFGDVQDEFDLDLSVIEILNNERIAIKGDAWIGEINELLHLELSDQNADTIAGLLLYSFGRIPQKNDEIIIDSNSFRIEKMTGNRIDMVSILASPNQIKMISSEKD